jgi:hypothetical protein
MDSELDMDIDWYDLGDDNCNTSIESDYDNYCFIDDDTINSIKSIVNKHDFETYNDFYITNKTIFIIQKYNNCLYYSTIMCTIISTLFIYLQFWLLHQ